MKTKKLLTIAMTGVLAGGMLASTSCRRAGDTAWHSEERVRIELEHHLQLLNYRFDTKGGGLTDELEETIGRTERNKLAVADLKAQLAGLEREVEDLDTKMAQLAEESAREARKKALGTQFETLEVANGRSYQDVTVTQITEGGVAIRHSSGSARFRPSDLTAEQQRLFGISSVAAAQEERIEASEAVAYERHLDAAAIAEGSPRDTRSQARRSSTRTTPSLAAAIARHHVEDRPLAQSARPVGSGNSVYRVRRSSRPRYYYVYPTSPYQYGHVSRTKVKGLYEWCPGAP